MRGNLLRLVIGFLVVYVAGRLSLGQPLLPW
jgi:hypothetical protein